MERYRIILALAVAASALACSKKEEFKYDPSERTVFDVTLQRAALGGDSQDEHVWSEGDFVGVFGSQIGDNEKYLVRHNEFGKTGTAVMYDPCTKGDRIIAYYPYEKNIPGASAESIPFSLEQRQSFSEKALDQFLSCCKRRTGVLEGDRIDLSYPAGVLSLLFDLDMDMEVDSVDLECPGLAVAGELAFTAERKVIPTFNSKSSVRLVCDGTVGTRKTDGTLVPFNIVMAPGEYKGSSANIVVHRKDDVDLTIKVTTAFAVEALDIEKMNLTTICFKGTGAPGFSETDGFVTVK